MSTASPITVSAVYRTIPAARIALGTWAENVAGIRWARTLSFRQLLERVGRDDRAHTGEWRGAPADVLDALRAFIVAADFDPSAMILGAWESSELDDLAAMAFTVYQGLR